MEDFYRIKIKFLDQRKLSGGFKGKFKKELAIDHIYLSIRLSPTTFKQSAAISSLPLAHIVMQRAKHTLVGYGPVELSVQSYPVVSDFMKSIIDTDSRMLSSHIDSRAISVV